MTCAVSQDPMHATDYRVSVFKDDLPLRRYDGHALWSRLTDPPLRLFNASNARILHLNYEEDERERKGSMERRKPTRTYASGIDENGVVSGSQPRPKSWYVTDSQYDKT